jgi:hypothetical protein
MKSRKVALMKNWGAMMRGDQIMSLALAQKDVADKTNFSADVVLSALTGSSSKSGDDRKLVVTVNDELKQSRIFEAVVTFVHPATLTKWQNDRLAKEKRLGELRKRADFFTKLIVAAVVAFLLLVCAVFVSAIISRKRDKNRMDNLLKEIEKREDLVAKGHFVAAKELVDKYLAYFPDDTAVRAFRERLLDFTNNDPKKAQMAYVEAQKMRQRLNMYGQNANISLLSGDERRELNNLVPYHPELKAALGLVLQIEDQQQKYKELAPQIQSVKALISSAKLAVAHEECEALLLKHPENPAAKELHDRIDELKYRSAKLIAECSSALVSGDLARARTLLAEATKICVDSPETLKMTAGMREAKGISGIKLSSKNGPFTLAILFKDRVMIGRPDGGDIPDISIDDRRMSRRHAQITLRADGVGIEDLGSTAGTVVGGERVTSGDLSEGKTLTMAKAFDFAVSVKRGEDGTLNSALLKSGEQAFMLVKTDARFEFDGHDCRFSKRGLVVYRMDNSVWAAEGDQVRFIGSADPLYLDGIQVTVEVQR